MAITNKYDDLHENWMVEEHENVISELLASYNIQSTIVEIGSWKGRSAIFMLKKNEYIKLNCFDIWPNKTKQYFKNNLFKYDFLNRVNIIEDKSINIKKYFKKESIDFIYLDACHKEESVYWDLLECFPLLKKDGLLLGDDWQKKQVQKAVMRVIQQNIYDLLWTKYYTFLLKIKSKKSFLNLLL